MIYTCPQQIFWEINRPTKESVSNLAKLRSDLAKAISLGPKYYSGQNSTIRLKHICWYTQCQSTQAHRQSWSSCHQNPWDQLQWQHLLLLRLTQGWPSTCGWWCQHVCACAGWAWPCWWFQIHTGNTGKWPSRLVLSLPPCSSDPPRSCAQLTAPYPAALVHPVPSSPWQRFCPAGEDRSGCHSRWQHWWHHWWTGSCSSGHWRGATGGTWGRAGGGRRSRTAHTCTAPRAAARSAGRWRGASCETWDCAKTPLWSRRERSAGGPPQSPPSRPQTRSHDLPCDLPSESYLLWWTRTEDTRCSPRGSSPHQSLNPPSRRHDQLLCHEILKDSCQPGEPAGLAVRPPEPGSEGSAAGHCQHVSENGSEQICCHRTRRNMTKWHQLFFWMYCSVWIAISGFQLQLFLFLNLTFNFYHLWVWAHLLSQEFGLLLQKLILHNLFVHHNYTCNVNTNNTYTVDGGI